jgi:DNA-binding NarL/FixJ family response regulator
VNDPRRIRVLIADDHPLVRLGLVALLGGEADMQVVAEAADGQEALEQFRAHRPDVTITDLRMPRAGGLFAIEAIRSLDRAARILVLTMQTGDDVVYRALQAGADGYLTKDVPASHLLEAIRAVDRGGTWIPVDIAGRMVACMQQMPLSARETEVLQHIARGFSNKEIAGRLHVSESTIRTYVASLLEKLGADNRTHAVNLALRRNIIDMADAIPA